MDKLTIGAILVVLWILTVVFNLYAIQFIIDFAIILLLISIIGPYFN